MSKTKTEKTTSKYQKFEAITISRKQIKKAPYNPRSIDEHARKKLRKSLEKRGLVETLIWNRRTGNLVGGHQRISILDDLEGNEDYQITVAAVDMDEKAEREMNIFLNNPTAQGSYDANAIQEMLPTVDLSAIGFDAQELEAFTGITLDSVELLKVEHDPLAEAGEKLKKMREQEKKYKEKKKAGDDVDHYFVVVFPSHEECDEMMEYLDQPLTERYVDGPRLKKLLEGREIPQE